MRPLLSMLSSESEATVATRASLLERLKDWEDQASWQQLFDWHVIRGRPVSEVSRRLQVTATQVYFAKYRVSALLRKEVRRLKQEWG
jgi:hypothetical protein